MPLKKYALISTGTLLLALLLSFNSSAQQSVTGKIISKADNQPVVGATVKVDGANSATQTKSDGTFIITSKKTITSLIISAIGFETVRIPVNGRSELNEVSLAISTTSLNDIVVTGYTVQRKKDITGAVSVVNVKDLKSVPAGSPEQMLQGQASGVNIITSGAPGGPSNILIRGITSFGNTDPLVIIDGSPASLHDINANDIESFRF